MDEDGSYRLRNDHNHPEFMDAAEFDALQEGQRPEHLDIDELWRCIDRRLETTSSSENKEEDAMDDDDTCLPTTVSLNTEQDLGRYFNLQNATVTTDELVSMCSGYFPMSERSDSPMSVIDYFPPGSPYISDNESKMSFEPESIRTNSAMSIHMDNMSPVKPKSPARVLDESSDIFTNVTEQESMSLDDFDTPESFLEVSCVSENKSKLDQTGGSVANEKENGKDGQKDEKEEQIDRQTEFETVGKDEQRVSQQSIKKLEKTQEPNINIRDLYDAVPFEKDSWRDSWARRGYRLTFKPEFAHLVVDNHELYATAILDLAAQITQGQKDISMGVGIEFDQEEVEAFHIPYYQLSKMTTKFLLNEINDRIQSARGIASITKDMLNIELTFRKPRTGSGLTRFRPRTTDVLGKLKDSGDLFETERRSIYRKQQQLRETFITIEADDSDCDDAVDDEEEEEEEDHFEEPEEVDGEIDSDKENDAPISNDETIAKGKKHECHIQECEGKDESEEEDDEEDEVAEDEEEEGIVDCEEAKERRRGSRKGVIVKNNVFENCLATAFLQGKAYCDKEAERCSAAVYTRYVRVNDDKPARSKEQRQEAQDLLIAAGISKNRNFTLKDVRKLQRHVTDYQIIVMGAAFDTQPIYIGPYRGADRRIGLLMDQEHFQHILNLPLFMGTKFWCSVCNSRNSCAKRHYRCPLKCPKCLSEACKKEPPAEEAVKCETCGVSFRNSGCYDRHLKKGDRNGKSRCEETKLCKKCKKSYYTNRGITHFCGKSYCRQCRCYKKPKHRHMLAVSKPNENKKKPFRRIFFDLETYVVEDETTGRKVHRVCLAQALRCCPECNDDIPDNLDEARGLSCETCSPDGYRFFEFGNIDPGDEDVDVLQEFGDWLINKRHRGFSVIAHNLKGFDGQLLLEYVLKSSSNIPAPKTLILAGRKLNFMNICDIRFVDSYNYIHAALSKFSDAFDVPEIKKGEFPHKFVKPKNFIYDGPMPAKKYYSYDRRTKAAKDAFDAFYDPLVKNGYQFNFRDEIREYCYSDVALLAAGMVKFEAAFKEETNVILFEETVTAASAAIKTFQRNYLKPFTMALDVDPSGSKINQSALAGRYLAYMHEVDGYPEIQHKYNIGEFQTPSNHFVDGYIHPCAQYDKGLIIEINGCFHHAHECSYGENSVMRGGKYAKDIRARDARRLKQLEEFCPVIVVWECQIREDARHNRVLARYLENNLKCGPLVMKEALYGGRTEPIRLKQEIPADMKGYYVDFNSLYPTCMKFDEYPVGEPEHLMGSMFDVHLPMSSPDVLRGCCRGLISCKVLPPKKLFFPVLPYRSGGKLFFSLCRKCTDDAAESEETVVHDTPPKCIHEPEYRAFYGTWTHVELALALEMGYVILEIFGAVNWRRWSKYYKNGEEVDHGLFSEYVDTFTKGKLEASGPPQWVSNDDDLDQYIADVKRREGIQLTKESIKKDETKKQMFKLLLNSLWGKFGQRVDVKKTFIVKSANQFHRIFEDPQLRVLTTDKIGDCLVIVAEHVSGAAEPLSTSAMPYAVFTTSHARVRLYRLLLTIFEPEKNVLYMDTDSLIYMAKSCPHPELMGDTLGQLKNELVPGARLEKWVTTGPKSYAIQQRLPDGSVKLELKCKGFPKTGQSEQGLTFELMDRMVTAVLNGESPIYAEINYFAIQRDKNHVLYNTETLKKFKFTFKKRLIMRDSGTLPIGYKDEEDEEDEQDEEFQEDEEL